MELGAIESVIQELEDIVESVFYSANKPTNEDVACTRMNADQAELPNETVKL